MKKEIKTPLLILIILTVSLILTMGFGNKQEDSSSQHTPTITK
jgi:hypothetical protein